MYVKGNDAAQRSPSSGPGAAKREALNGPRVRVLVVDDSAYVRKVVKEMLSRSPFIEVVGTARDGDEALEMVDGSSPTWSPAI